MKHMISKSEFVVYLGLCVLLLPAPYASEAAPQIGKVITAHSNHALRAAPSPKAPIIWHIKKGDSLTVRKRHEKWLNIRMNNGGRIGWVAPDIIASVPLQATKNKNTF
ncbi:MAG: SH3 domain-containing protein, partial [Mariprofundaceae bacterium]|nr:SH3 domain-containing protein [Mariprofundaceae bacterium]